AVAVQPEPDSQGEHHAGRAFGQRREPESAHVSQHAVVAGELPRNVVHRRVPEQFLMGLRRCCHGDLMIARRSLSNESGVALVTAMLVVMLMSALMVGMFAALTTDTRSHAADRDQTQAYAAAQAGLEKLTSALAQLFNADASPSVAQGNPAAVATSITTGPYTGFQGLITKYTATITAASKAGAEVRLRREIQTVAVPV